MNTHTPVATKVQPDQVLQQVSQIWDQQLIEQLSHYIALPAKSPLFDPDWKQHGFIEAALAQALAWVQSQHIAGLHIEIVRLAGRTPVLFFELAASHGSAAQQGEAMAEAQSIMFYGHLDKQPESCGWRADLGPWTPKYEDGKLYGRGSADDGYAIYAAMAAIMTLQSQQLAHPRIVGLIETCEESGSYDLPSYLALLQARLGDIGLVICLDSGAGNYERLWLTNSLRGNASGVLKVEVLREGVHSGEASGVVASSFRILRLLLDRLEDSRSGQLLPVQLHCQIPEQRLLQAQACADMLGAAVYRDLPWPQSVDTETAAGVLPVSSEPLQLLLNRSWRPSLSVTGAAGLPELAHAGNVLRPFTALKLSLRLPPLVDAAAALAHVKTLLEQQPPYQARVSFDAISAANGWNAPDAATWFERALTAAGQNYFGAAVGYIGQGGTIPLMNLLATRYPAAQMMVCGVLGPGSNAHGPNEFLHIPYVKKLSASLVQVIAGAAGVT